MSDEPLDRDRIESQPNRSGLLRLLVAALVVAILLALYPAAYYVLVRRVNRNGGTDPASGLFILEHRPAYPIRFVGWLFDPLHRLDRNLRPEYWAPRKFDRRTHKEVFD